MLAPALVWPSLDVAAAMAEKRLPRRFRRAEKRSLQDDRVLDLLATALGIDAPPAGGLARLADGLDARGGIWFRAKPVRLVPDRDSLRMVALGADAAPNEEELQALIGVAREHFGTQLSLEQGASGRLYAALADVHDVVCVPPQSEAGKKLLVTSLADGPDARRLRAFLNELQMLWFEHPVNVARHKAQRPEVNSLWLWGNGRLPAPPALEQPIELVGSAPEMAGLARWLGCRHRDQRAVAESAGRQVGAGTLVAIDAEDEPFGQPWLEAFVAARMPWRLYTGAGEWTVPARRRLFAGRA